MSEKNKNQKMSFEDGLSLMLFACYATQPFTCKDIQEAVFDFHRSTINSILHKFVAWNYLERISENHYRATQYAKDILNAKGGIVS